jgi:Fe-S cluster assembly protein SufD
MKNRNDFHTNSIIDTNRVLIYRNLKRKDITISECKKNIIILFYTESIDSHINIRITREGAQASVIGIVIGKKDSIISLNTSQIHVAPQTTSNLFVKSVCFQGSSFTFEGLIHVENIANKSDAYQRNDNLMMSPDVHVGSNPILEILTNDLRCTHGATISTISSDQIHYLQSRGIDETAAKTIIIEGFLWDAFKDIKDSGVRKILLKEYNTCIGTKNIFQ